MKSIANQVSLAVIEREDKQYEQVVYAELLIPEVANVYGDYWTRQAIREACYAFAKAGYGIDVNHDNVDRTGAVYVVESFIVRAGDPDFIDGSWVIGMRIEDADLWQQVLNNELNGYSYEAVVAFLSGVLQKADDGIRVGIVEPSLEDGHTHTFLVTVDADNRPISGGTDTVDGHSHTISLHTVTDESDGHTHRYNLVSGKDGK